MKRADSSVEIAKAIAANSLLSLLETREQHALTTSAQLQRFAKNQTIYKEGDAATEVWIVISGQVKIVKFSEGGSVLALELMIASEIFGAVFYADNPTYPCTALAVRETAVVKFQVAKLFSLLEKSAPLQKAMLGETCRRFCHAQNMRGLAMESAAKRVAYALVYLHGKFGDEIPHSRATLAELAGTTVETAIRITSALSKQSMIATKRGRIEVLTLGRLKKLVFGVAARTK
ncbi:MAG: Crp/Fnr family transcriptional regulator [Chthoniobacterales bacterium]